MDVVGWLSSLRVLCSPNGEHSRQYFRLHSILCFPSISIRFGKDLPHFLQIGISHHPSKTNWIKHTRRIKMTIWKQNCCFWKVAVSVSNGRRCRTRTAIPAPKAGVLPLHHILCMVEPRGFAPLSEIPTWTRPSYAIYGFSAFALRRKLCYRQTSTQGVQWFAHLHHLVSFNSDKENCYGWMFLWPQTLTHIQLVRRFGNPGSAQAATFSASIVAKAGWIMMTVSVLSFNCLVCLEAVIYLRVLYSQNPVESETAPY